jgi:hypothetical protein
MRTVAMRTRDLATAAGILTALASAPLAGCVTRIHAEAAALRMARPSDVAGLDPALMRGAVGYPSAGGDILKGTSPEDLAAARARISKSLTEALSKP